MGRARRLCSKLGNPQEIILDLVARHCELAGAAARLRR
jgi:hypothetical protein